MSLTAGMFLERARAFLKVISPAKSPEKFSGRQSSPFLAPLNTTGASRIKVL